MTMKTASLERYSQRRRVILLSSEAFAACERHLSELRTATMRKRRADALYGEGFHLEKRHRYALNIDK